MDTMKVLIFAKSINSSVLSPSSSAAMETVSPRQSFVIILMTAEISLMNLLCARATHICSKLFFFSYFSFRVGS